MQRFTIIILSIALSACSTIMKQDYEELSIETTPAGAIVSVSDGMKCHTPCSLELERGSDYNLKIQKPGFKEENYEVSGSSWDAWLWGNIAFIVFPVAIAVDFYTGYAYDFDPETIKVELKKE